MVCGSIRSCVLKLKWMINWYFLLQFDWPILPETAHAKTDGTSDVSRSVGPK